MTEPKPLKSHASFPQQLDILRARGLLVQDEAAALAALARLGYYRLSGYFYPLRKTLPPGQTGRQDDFCEGASIELVLALAEFDKRLRLLALYALESTELAVRVALAHHLGKLDAEAHLNPRLLDRRFTQPSRPGQPSAHELWLRRHEQLLADSKEDFVIHHRERYGGRLPIWVAIEVWDFGTLSRFFSGMAYRDRNRVASLLGATDGEVLKSWLRAFNFVRNVSAHHARLWNRRNIETVALPKLEQCRWLAPLHGQPDACSKVFGTLACLLVMMRTIAPRSDWPARLKAHLQTFPTSDLLSLSAAGFPTDWEALPLWLTPNP